MEKYTDKNRNKKAEIKGNEELKDVQFVMNSREGRRFIWRLLERAGVFRTSFTGNANQTAFNEGQRNQGLVTFNEVMTVCPDLYLKMAGEAEDAEKAREKT